MSETGGSRRWWYLSKETILMVVGIGVILTEVVNAEVLGRTFHYEFLILGAALCGVSLTQKYGDPK